MTDDNLHDLSYRELKQKAAREGISAKGRKEEILERMIRAQKGDLENKVSLGEKDNPERIGDTPKNAEEAKALELSQKQSSQKISINLDQEQAIVQNIQRQKLEQDLHEILKGKASFYYNADDNTYNFTGGNRQAECITATANDSVILRTAKYFVSKCIIGVDSQKTVIQV